jgi:hypothetical protein
MVPAVSISRLTTPAFFIINQQLTKFMKTKDQVAEITVSYRPAIAAKPTIKNDMRQFITITGDDFLFLKKVSGDGPIILWGSEIVGVIRSKS